MSETSPPMRRRQHMLSLTQFLALPEDLRIIQKCARCNTLYRELDNIGQHKCFCHPGIIREGYLRPGDQLRRFYTCCGYPVEGDRRLPLEPLYLNTGCTPCDHRPSADLDAFVPLPEYLITMGVPRPPEKNVAQDYSEIYLREHVQDAPRQFETVNGPVDVQSERAMIGEIQEALLSDEASQTVIREKLRENPALQAQARLHEQVNTIWPESRLLDNGNGAVDVTQRSADYFLEQAVLDAQQGDNPYHIVLAFLLVRRYALAPSGTRVQFIQDYFDTQAGTPTRIEYI